MKGVRDIASRALGALPDVALPGLGRAVDIPVYLIHNSANPEDYFFIFDFEQFVEQSRSGIFVRPRLQVWAGRSDFDRVEFARQFREAFGREFDIARAQLAAETSTGRGWFSWNLGFDIASGFVANVILLVALSAGRLALRAVPLPQILRGKSDETKLEDSIEVTKSRVDAALRGLTIVLHRDLYRHAWREGRPGPLNEIDYDAWPLPAHVMAHLGDGKSGSWW